jgi:hypothetical protein
VFELKKALESSPANLTAALELYEAGRLADTRALCQLVSFGYPYQVYPLRRLSSPLLSSPPLSEMISSQYNQAPLKKTLCLLNIGLRSLLHRLLPDLVHLPACILVSEASLTYSQVLRRVHRTTWRLLLTVGALLFWGVSRSGLLRSLSLLR